MSVWQTLWCQPFLPTSLSLGTSLQFVRYVFFIYAVLAQIYSACWYRLELHSAGLVVFRLPAGCCCFALFATWSSTFFVISSAEFQPLARSVQFMIVLIVNSDFKFLDVRSLTCLHSLSYILNTNHQTFIYYDFQ